jgi:membrane peptidoglycan carboxypeptidase
MTDPYRGSARRPGPQRRGSHDDGLDSFLSELSGRGGNGRSSGRHSASHDSAGWDGSSNWGSGSRGSSRPAGRASVGRASVGRASVGSAGAGEASGSAAVGRAAVGRASVGGATGRAQVRPGMPNGEPGPSRMDRHRQRPGAGQLAKKRARRRKMVAFCSVAVMLLGLMVIAGTYFVVNVPTPTDLANMKQNSTILSADGKVLARVGTENRKFVKIDKIPKHVQHAVVTAEDRTFYTNNGIDTKGIARAAWNNITDDDVEGASTITQQYVRNALDLTREHSYTRKLKEAVMAVKLNREQTKDQILEGYLNTIYFGRNAYGIEAASEAYFNKPVEKLKPEEGALLATVIKNPSGYDPENNADRAKERWQWVLDNMVHSHWLDAATASNAKFPKTRPAKEAQGAQFGLDKPTGLIKKYVVQELGQLGISEQEIYTGGYTIKTTIDTRMQRAAESAATSVLKGEPKNLATGLVAVEPGTGRVRAYYGGKHGVTGFDYAGSRHPPGSSFKAYVLATALENDISIKSYWDGSSPQKFPDRTSPISNSENNNRCKRCTLERATVMSLNTTYYALTYKLGKGKVIDLAHKAGIRVLDSPNGTGTYDHIDLGDPDAAKHFSTEVGIGQYPVSVLDNANGFATFAANGTSAKAHFVERVSRGDEEIAKVEPETTEAFSKESAADADHVLRQVVTAGGNDLDNGRPSAAKTGTWQYNKTQDNAHAWMCGYTPQLAASVWIGSKGKEGPIKTKEGMPIYGAGLPGKIWKAFMNKALAGKPIKQFPTPSYRGDDGAGNAKSPSPSPSPTPKHSKPHGPPQPTNTEPLPSDTPTCRPTDPWCGGP